ncbi:MAG: DVUA0089 family protein [Planctomycetota bacterium]
MRVAASIPALLLVPAITAGAASAQSAPFSVSAASAAGDLGNAGNSVQTGLIADSFVASSLTWSGTLTSSPNFFFFEEDVYASIEGPNGIGYAGPIAGEQGIVLGPTAFSGWSAGFAPGSVNGDYRFEAYTPNTFANSTDWTISNAEFAFNEALFPDAMAVETGDAVSAGIVEGEILWYSIDHSGGALQFSTAGSIIDELDGGISTDDTLIALFDAQGQLVDFNDDAGSGISTSELMFADLAAGDYRLAVTGATLGTRVGSSFISTSHDGVGTIALTVAVPAPASLGLLAGFGLVARRRR